MKHTYPANNNNLKGINRQLCFLILRAIAYGTCFSESMMLPLIFSIFFAAVIRAVLVRFSEDPEIVRDSVHLEEN